MSQPNDFDEWFDKSYKQLEDKPSTMGDLGIMYDMAEDAWNAGTEQTQADTIKVLSGFLRNAPSAELILAVKVLIEYYDSY